MSEIIEKQTKKCGECNSSNILGDYESGELVCQDCGLVLSSTLLNLGPEWRAFEPKDKEKLPRIGPRLNWSIQDKGLSTTIGWQGKDTYGKKLDPESLAKIYRLRKWHQRSKLSESTQRNLSHALNEINKLSDKLNIPRSVEETSSIIYRRALKNQLIRGRTIQNIASACIYMACRQCGVIRTLEDVANAANMKKKDVASNYRFLLRKLKPSVPQTKSSGYISKIISNLALSGETERLAMKILSEVSDLKLTNGRGPRGIAGACVYIGSSLVSEHRTQGDIAKEAQTTEVTIRNRYKEITKHLNFKIIL